MGKIFKLIVYLFVVTNASWSFAYSHDCKSGMMIDCARRYNSVDFIKGFIDSMAYDNSYLILHLTDNEGVGIECQYLNQTESRALKMSDGSLLNPDTGKRFLSYAQVHDLIKYASERNVEIIPEIEMPGHFNGFFELAILYKGLAFVEDVSVNQIEVPGELRMNSEEAKNFAYDLIMEYGEAFKDCRRFSIGADEYWTNYGDLTVSFINSVNDLLASAGLSMIMCNDLITKVNMQDFNPNITVIYWSYDGMADDDDVRAERIAKRASLPEIQHEGFDVLLTNSYYLYFVPSSRNTNHSDLDYTVSDIVNNWSYEKWDDEYEGGLENHAGIKGSHVSLWLEMSEDVSDDVIQNQVVRMYKAMRNKMKAETMSVIASVAESNMENQQKAKFVMKNGRLLLSFDGIYYTLYGECVSPR